LKGGEYVRGRANRRQVNERDHDGEKPDDMEDQDQTLKSGEKFGEHGVDKDCYKEHRVEEESSLPPFWLIRGVVKNEKTLDDATSEIGARRSCGLPANG
jgi:hypothetical protein